MALEQSYSSDFSITFDVSSVGSDDNFLAGEESNEVDNTTNKYLEVVVNCDGITGNASTGPVAGDSIRLYLWGSHESRATSNLDDLEGTGAARTLTNAGVKSGLVLVGSAVAAVTTAGLKYYIKSFGVAASLGYMPKFWGLFLTHNLGATLAAGQSGIWTGYGIKVADV